MYSQQAVDAGLRSRVAILVVLLIAIHPVSGWATSLHQVDPAGAFERTWERTDRPVDDGTVTRTWMWGPEPFTGILGEPYTESPGGERLVSYFDKSRMEVTYPDGDQDSIWYVTNGLLVVEMIEGLHQVGDDDWQGAVPADVVIAGDLDAPGITYADINRFGLRDAPAAEEQTLITQRIDQQGTITTQDELGELAAFAQVFVPETGHTVADVFWTFMTSTGTVWQDGGYVDESLFPNPFYATGFPITEAYWSTVTVSGAATDVLWQCFERRCLTFTPRNPEGWQVESGNVGLHYHHWRYGQTNPPDPIIFSSNRAGSDDIWVVGGDGSGLRQLTRSEANDQLATWSPDGTRIAFLRGHWGGDQFARDIYVMNADGSAQTRLTEQPADFDRLAWSPDGEHLAVSGYLGGSQLAIHVMRADGTELRAVTPDHLWTQHFSWSPDGTRIAFSGFNIETDFELYVVNIDGTGLEQLTDGVPWIQIPAWSPDGSRIAFMTAADPSGEWFGVYTIGADGSDMTRLTEFRPSARALVWSPDGTRLAFTANSEIYVLGADGEAPLPVSTEAEGNLKDQPVWSPDGNRIAFTSFQAPVNQEIFVVDISGREATNVTRDPGRDRYPAWSAR